MRLQPGVERNYLDKSGENLGPFGEYEEQRVEENYQIQRGGSNMPNDRRRRVHRGIAHAFRVFREILSQRNVAVQRLIECRVELSDHLLQLVLLERNGRLRGNLDHSEKDRQRDNE